MSPETGYTVPEAARLISEQHAFPGRPVPAWKVRRVCDELPFDVPRVGRYRVIPAAVLPAIVRRLQAEGWLPASIHRMEGAA